jgi:hypothetical protein
MKRLIILIVLLFYVSTAWALDEHGPAWKIVDGEVSPGVSATSVNLTGYTTIGVTVTETDPIAMPVLANVSSQLNSLETNFTNFTGNVDAKTLQGYSSAEFFNRSNHTGFQTASTISDFNDTVIKSNLQTGIETHAPGDDGSCKITRNSGDITKYDRSLCHYHIQGIEYEIAASTVNDPGFGAGGNHRWVLVNSAGILLQTATPTRTQKRTALVLARIQAEAGQLGPGSDISDLGVMDFRYLTSEEGYHNEDYLSRVFGGLFVDGGLITENGSTPNQLDISAGELYHAQRGQQTWGSFTNISGLHVYHNSTSIIVDKETLIIDQVNYDNGLNLVPMSNNNYHCGHTVLMTPRGTQDAEFSTIRVFYIHCTTQHSDLQGALDAGIDYGPFISKAVSGLVPLAQVVVKKNTGIVDIIDYRDRIGAAGGSIVAGSITLQGAYNNSSPGASEIILNAAQDGFVISDNSTSVTDLFKINNFANTTTYFQVDTSGIQASGGIEREVAPTMANYSIIGAFVDWTSVDRLARRDGDYHRIQETAGDIGYQYWLTFPGIKNPTRVIFEGCVYAGANNHDNEAIIFSNTSSAWHDLRLNAVDATPSESDFQHVTFSDEGVPYDRTYNIPEPAADYVDVSGNVLVGIWHPEPGLTGHDMYCDSIHVIDR